MALFKQVNTITDCSMALQKLLIQMEISPGDSIKMGKFKASDNQYLQKEAPTLFSLRIMSIMDMEFISFQMEHTNSVNSKMVN